MLSPTMVPSLTGAQESRVMCLTCDSSKGVEKVAMPYVFKYLASELAAMNIRINLELST